MHLFGNVVLGELPDDLSGVEQGSPTRERPLSRLCNSITRSRSRSRSRSRRDSDTASISSKISLSSKVSHSSKASRSSRGSISSKRRKSKDRKRSMKDDDSTIVSQVKVVPISPSAKKDNKEVDSKEKERAKRMRWKEFTKRMACYDDSSDDGITEDGRGFSNCKHSSCGPSFFDDFVEEFMECSYFCQCLAEETADKVKIQVVATTKPQPVAVE